MSKRKTLGKLKLAERSIYRGWAEKNPCEHVRAELDRLARQVRKSKANLEKNDAVLKLSKDARDYVLSERCEGGINSLDEVLDLIREAKR